MKTSLPVALAALALWATASVVPVAAATWSEEEVQAFIASAPGEEAYPDAAAVFLKAEDIVEIGPDGAMTASRNSLVKVLTLMGRENYSNRTLLYDSDQGSVSLVRGATIRSTGRVVEVEPDAVNDVTPAFLEGATMYANVLEKVISFPVAGPGSVMELALEETRKPATDGSFSGIEFLGGDDPTLDAEFTLRFPEGSPTPGSVAFTGLVGGVTVEKTSEPGVLSFSAHDVPGVIPEENMPPAAELYPRVVYTSYGSWDEAAAFFAGEFFPHVQADGPVAERASGVTTGLAGFDERLRAIFLDVATNVRNVTLPLGVGGYDPNDASVVLANRYGDTRDKTALLVSMLRSAGFEAWPAAVAERRVPADLATALESVPTLRGFDRLLVAVPVDGGYRFLDPMLDDVSYGYLRYGRGNTALVIKDDGTGERVAVPPFEPKDNSAQRFLSIMLKPDGSASVFATCDLAGYFDRKTRMELKDAPPTDVQKAFDLAANALSAGADDVDHTLSDLRDLAQPVHVQQRIEAPDFAVPQGDMMIVRVPPFPYEFASSGIAPTLSERKLPFDFPCEMDSYFEAKIRVPEGYDVARIPDPITVSTNTVDVVLTCDWFPEERSIFWRQSIVVKSRRIEVPEYAGFKAAYDAVLAPNSRLILLSKPSMKAAGGQTGTGSGMGRRAGK